MRTGGFRNGGGGSSKSMNIPEKAVGLVLGRKGATIQALQRVPGIYFVNFDRSTLVLSFSGTAQAMADVAAEVEKLINRAASPNIMELSLTIVDMGARGAVAFMAARQLQLPVDMADAAAGTDYFAAFLVPRGGIEDEMAAMSLRAEPRECGNKGRFAVGLESRSYTSEMKAMLPKLAELPARARLRVEARLGLLLFALPRGGVVPGQRVPVASMPVLEFHKDVTPRFFAQMRQGVVERVRRFLEGRGFTAVPPEQRKVVHLVDMVTSRRVSITVAELEDGSDPRAKGVGKEELERLAKCRDYYEVLGLSEGSCSDADVKKAYYRIAKLVHPDKNTHPGAESAMKAVLACKEGLEDATKRAAYARRRLPPPSVEVAAARKQMRVVKCHGEQRKHLVIDVLKSGEELGFRTWVRSYEDQSQDAELMRFLNEAWKQQKDGMLTTGTGSRFRIDTVRYKTTYRFMDGDLKVIVDNVRQRDVGKEAHERWEVEIRSQELKEALKATSSGAPAGFGDRFQEFLDKVNTLGAAMTSQTT